MWINCVHLNKRSVIFIIFSYIINHIKISSTANNEMDSPLKSNNNKPNQEKDAQNYIYNKNQDDDTQNCVYSNSTPCNSLTFPCIKCNYSHNCIYGKNINVSCEVKLQKPCLGDREFTKTMICRYCYQTESWEHTCVQKGNFGVASNQYYRTNCTVKPDILCLGNRTFYKNVRCNWTQGIKWSTALIISITLGGFGADRFYLGYWQEGIGKLFSFGGLGVWTLIDVILISLHYLGPVDGSLYI